MSQVAPFDWDQFAQRLKADSQRREDMAMRYAAERRAEESHAIAMRDARARVQAGTDAADYYRRELRNPVASTTLGGGRLATLADATALNMTNPEGVFLGALEGQLIYYSGDSHLLTYASTGSGKNRDVIVSNLAHVRNRSVVCIDVKGGENAYSTAGWRRREFSHDTITINPWGLHGAPSFRVNPFQRVIDIAKAGGDPYMELWAVMEALIPVANTQGDDKWARVAAQELGGVRIEYLALTNPDACTLSSLYDFVNNRDGIDALLFEMSECEHAAVAGLAGKHYDVATKAHKQFAAVLDSLGQAVKLYRPNTILGHATSATDFDIGSLKSSPKTVYLIVPPRMLKAVGRWLSLIVSCMIEDIADARGPIGVLFLLDELANLPYIDGLPKALKLYRGRGVQLWGFCQGRESLKDVGYSEHIIKDFEQQAAVLQMWIIEDTTLLRDIEVWSGKTGVAIATRAVSFAGNPTASVTVNETVRPVLQAEDIRGIGVDGRQLLKLAGVPYLMIADRIAWDTIPIWAAGLNDYRDLV